MLRRIALSLALLCTVALAAPLWSSAAAAASDPSEQQIYQAAGSGRLTDAEQMIAQVLRDHPTSGKAHYVAAEVYARAGALARARAELSSAQSLEPGLPFARPSSVQALQRQLADHDGGGYAVRAAPRAHFPWGFALLIVGVIAVWAWVRRRAAMARASAYIPYGTPGPGTQGAPMPGVVPPYGGAPYGMAPYGYGSPAGSGLMGSVASGLAVGAGIAAGEELVGHLFGSNAGGAGGIIPAAGAQEWVDAAPVNADMGGNDFGITDGSNSWDDGGAGGGDFGGGDFGGGGDWT